MHRYYPLSFFDIYSLSMSSLGCKDLCIVVTFLVFWSVCWGSSVVHFKNGPENVIKGDIQGVYPFNEILGLYSFNKIPTTELGFKKFSRSFKTFFLFVYLFFNHHFWIESNIPTTCKFLFLQAFWFFLDLIFLFLQSFVVFHSSLLARHIFLCQIQFPYPDYILLLFGSESPILFHFLQTVGCLH